MKPEVESEILERLADWRREASLLRWLHAVLGAVAVVCSVVVAAKVNAQGEGLLQWLAIAAAIATGVLTAFDLAGKGNRMRRAWRHLNSALLRYRADPTVGTDSVIQAYHDGELMIGDSKSPV